MGSTSSVIGNGDIPKGDEVLRVVRHIERRTRFTRPMISFFDLFPGEANVVDVSCNPGISAVAEHWACACRGVYLH